MELELQEVREFLQSHVPFDALHDVLIRQVLDELTIHYLRRGEIFPPVDIEIESLYMVRSGAVEIRNKQGQLVEKLGEGDSYNDQCQNSVVTHGRTSEDSLIYRIPCQVIAELTHQSPSFERRITTSINRRLKQALNTAEDNGTSISSLSYSAIDLVDRKPVLIDGNTPIVDVARLMSKENVSSVLITQNNQLAGMVTDKDIRKRCVASERNPNDSVSTIMSNELVTVTETTPLAEALMLMTRHQIHHLPVMHQQQPVGNLSVSDLIRHLGTNSAFIASDIQKANSVEALSRISQRLPELQLHLTMSNTSARQMGEVISTITDNITRRLLTLAEEKLGPPPVDYVWLAGGSQGRHEQISHSDQDNALLIDNAMQLEHDEYFRKLSQFVSDGLNDCGFIYCPGDAMATNDNWRKPLSVWEDYFHLWITRPEKKALMLSSIFFDLRPVHGKKELFEQLQSSVLAKTKANKIFIAYMVSNALTHRPPLGFFRKFVLVHDEAHDHTLDIKHRGIIPVVDIARVFALSEGLPPVNTVERLAAAYESGALGSEMKSNLIDALEYIGRIRLEHQAQQIREGKPADNYIDPVTLSGLEKVHLKDAFRVIQSMQDVLESRHQAGRLI